MIHDLSTLTIEDFEPLLHKTVPIRFTPDVTLDAELTELTRTGHVYTDGARQPFSCIWRTQQRNEYYPQATFTMIHPEKGEMPVFLVPIGPDKEGMLYQTIFG